MEVQFTWQETDPSRPARDVLVRLVALDDTYDHRELAPYLLHPGARDGAWTGVVDLPDGLRSSYQLCPGRDGRVPRSGLDDHGWAALLATGGPDPNRDYQLGPCTYGNRALASIVELPGALPQPWWQRRAGVPRGAVHHRSTGRDWPSTVDVYTPPGPRMDRGLPLVVLLDGQVWTAIDAAATFDNLIADAVVPPFLAVMLGSAFGPTRVHGLSRPAVHLEYLRRELLPELVQEYGATRDPAQTILVGQSLGGLAAVHAGLRAPERFGVVVSQSGSFWWPGEAEGEIGGDEVLALAAAEPRGSVRFWLEAGSLEAGLVPANRELHAALAAAGHPVTYREYQGGHDFACWRGGLGDGIAAALAR